MHDRSAAWRGQGFQLLSGNLDAHLALQASDRTLCCCSYVDNLFAVSHSIGDAISILEDFEDQLVDKWDLSIKPDSRQCMAAAGSTDETPDADKWPQVATFHVLGHTIDSHGSVHPCWHNTRQAMWRRFWANAGSRCAHGLALTLRINLLSRAVGPVFVYRNSRWPPQKTVGGEVDRVQCKMAASFLRMQRTSGEEPAAYCKRRNRAAGALCRKIGLWSKRWFKRSVAWNKHLLRPMNFSTWSAQLIVYRGKAWLQGRRAAFLSNASVRGSCLTGKTGTRSFMGCPCTRWHDGIDYAESVL